MIIDRPIVTEKSLALAANGTYTFAVAGGSNKAEIAKAIENVYKVIVAKVRVLSVTGESVRRRTGLGKKPDWKKALVTLKKGDKIKDFEFEASKETKEEKSHDHKHTHSHK